MTGAEVAETWLVRGYGNRLWRSRSVSICGNPVEEDTVVLFCAASCLIALCYLCIPDLQYICVQRIFTLVLPCMYGQALQAHL